MPDPNAPTSTAQFPRLFRSLVLDPALLLARALDAADLARLVAEEVGPTRDRLFTPAVTAAVFLSQVSSDDQSCRSAVARLLAWRVRMTARPPVRQVAGAMGRWLAAAGRPVPPFLQGL